MQSSVVSVHHFYAPIWCNGKKFNALLSRFLTLGKYFLYFDRPVGMPKMEKVYLHNPSSEETITLVSISATTSHFHASFFQNRVSFFYFPKLAFLLPLESEWKLL